jgi:hypothetical protein
MAYSDLAEGESVFKIVSVLAQEGSYLENLTFKQCLCLMWAGLLEHNPDFPFEEFSKRPMALFVRNNLHVFIDAFISAFQISEIEEELPKSNEKKKKQVK